MLQHVSTTLLGADVFEGIARHWGPVVPIEREQQRFGERKAAHAVLVRHGPVEGEVGSPIVAYEDDIVTEIQCVEERSR